MAESLAIAQVTPYAWETDHPVNDYVRGVAAELAGRGHRVAIVAPSRSREALRASRTLIRAARERPDAVLGSDEPTVLSVGEALPLPTAPRRSSRPLPIDVSRTVEALMDTVAFDLVHVHEPWAPSVAASALRHSRALNVGGFHLPTERVISTQVARRFVELFFGRLDARLASFGAVGELVGRHFAAAYETIGPAAGSPLPTSSGDELVIGFRAVEERGSLRVLMRALRLLAEVPGWRAVLAAPEPATALRADLRERVSFVDELQAADVVVLGSAGELPAPHTLLEVLAGGGIPVATSIPIYQELLDEGARGPLFVPGDAETLAGQLRRLIEDDEQRRAYGSVATPARSWRDVADDVEGVYERLTARRHAGRIAPAVHARIARRPLIDVDLHMHTDHSHDCATPVEALLAAAREEGLGAIAVTDHNEISGAKDAARKAAGYGVKVIVAEEIKTADQGEVIGLFIDRKIPRGMTLAETIEEIKRQGGLVYVPHPFDRLHSVPDYEHLVDVVERIDAIEIFNARVAIAEFNEEAARFAAKYRIAAGAGSDAHVTAGLGSVRIRMRDFDGPEEFLASLREAEIIRTPASLLYVQALKFIQTKATPAPARRARRARRVRRAERRKS